MLTSAQTVEGSTVVGLEVPAKKAPARPWIGGSDIGAILGVSKRKTRLQVYLEKIGEAPPHDHKLKELFKRGKRAEPYILQAVKEDWDVEIIAANKRYRDEEHPMLSAEIDFEFIKRGQKSNGEIKSAFEYLQYARSGNEKMFGEPGTDQMPLDYIAQGMWGLSFTPDREACHFAVGFGWDVVPYVVMRDDAMIREMRSRALEFWHKHVVPRVPPEPETSEDVALLWPHGNKDTIVEADEWIKAALMTARHLRAEAKIYENGVEALDLTLRKFMRDATVLQIDGRSVATLNEQACTRVDVELLKVAHPDIYKQCCRKTTHRVLRLKSETN